MCELSIYTYVCVCVIVCVCVCSYIVLYSSENYEVGKMNNRGASIGFHV